MQRNQLFEDRGVDEALRAYFRSLNAAKRNTHKGEYLHLSTLKLLFMFLEECMEFCFAVLFQTRERAKEEFGDVVRVAGMLDRKLDN